MKYYSILCSCFTTQYWDDPRANGGVTLVEVSKRKNKFYRRYTGSNGKFRSSSEPEVILEKEIKELFVRAIDREENDIHNGRSNGKDLQFIQSLAKKWEIFS